MRKSRKQVLNSMNISSSICDFQSQLRLSPRGRARAWACLFGSLSSSSIERQADEENFEN